MTTSVLRFYKLLNFSIRLENQKIELTYALEQEKAKAPEISQEQLEYMLFKFREDCHNPDYADKLIDTFVNRIYYTNGQLVIWLNYTNTTADDKPEVEKIIIDTIKNREQFSSVLCNGKAERFRCTNHAPYFTPFSDFPENRTQ